jgi:hypothetical protein
MTNNNIPTTGFDLNIYNREMKVKRPLFMHGILYYDNKETFDIAELYLIDRLKHELKTNVHCKREIDYDTGMIIEVEKNINQVLLYEEYDHIHDFANKLYDNIKTYNQSIVINICKKTNSFILMLNHTLMDGVSMYTNIMSRLFYEYQSIDYVKQYNYTPITTELYTALTLAYHARILITNTITQNNARLNYSPDSHPIFHCIRIKNKLLKQIKSNCIEKVSLNIVILAYMCKYIFDNCKHKRNTLNILITYGFENKSRNNNYSFIHVCVNNKTIQEMIIEINSIITSNLYQIYGNYHLLHNFNAEYETDYKKTIDCVFSSIISNNLGNSSFYGYCHKQSIPIYISSMNSLNSEYTIMSLSISSNDINLTDNLPITAHTIDENTHN